MPQIVLDNHFPYINSVEYSPNYSIDELDYSLPKNWYINIAIPLEDIKISVEGKDYVMHELNYGDLIVCQSLNLYDAIKLLRLYENNKIHSYLNDVFSGYTYINPKYAHLKHPFVSARNNTSDSRPRYRFNA